MYTTHIVQEVDERLASLTESSLQLSLNQLRAALFGLRCGRLGGEWHSFFDHLDEEKNGLAVIWLALQVGEELRRTCQSAYLLVLGHVTGILELPVTGVFFVGLRFFLGV